MDEDTKKIIESFLAKASPAIRNFIASGELEGAITEITEDYNLNDDELTDLNNLVSFILIGLTNPDDLLSKIMEITALPQNMAKNLANEIQDIILLTFAPKNEPTTNSKVGESFEQIILNQARAMQPARPTGESVAGGPARAPGEVPQNLPTHPSQNSNPIQKPSTPAPQPSTEPQQNATHDYLPGQDPYREPLE